MTHSTDSKALVVARPALSTEVLRRRAPAVFANAQFDKTSADYVFISTQSLVEALRAEGFHPTDARQRWSRGDRLGYARHMIRFGAHEALSVVDCSPEIIHQLARCDECVRAPRWAVPIRVLQWLIVSLADLGVVRVPHRGNVIANVVQGARQLMDQLNGIGSLIEKMVRTSLDLDARRAFAERALAIRYAQSERFPFDADKLLEARRDADRADTLWCVYNRVQENVMLGGIDGKSARGRRVRSRPIRAVKEDVRLNVALWQEAMKLIRS